MKHFEELKELVVGILNALIKLTMVAGKTMGPQLGTLLVVIALLSALVFACFSAKMFEDFALRALQELLMWLSAALAPMKIYAGGARRVMAAFGGRRKHA
jgi:hypothetical protein